MVIDVNIPLLLDERGTNFTAAGDLGVDKSCQETSGIQGEAERAAHTSPSLLKSRGVLFHEEGLGHIFVDPSGHNEVDQIDGSIQAHGSSSGPSASAQNSKQDSEETILEFSNHQECIVRRRCKKKVFKKHNNTAIGNPKCFQFVKAVKEGKGTSRRKGGLGEGSSKEKAKHKGKHEEVMTKGGGFLLDESDVRASCSNHLEIGNPRTPASGLQLILEESGSLVPETPLATLSETSRKALDASRIHSLQKSNGFIFSVRDKVITSKMVELVNDEVVNDGFNGNVLGDQRLCSPIM